MRFLLIVLGLSLVAGVGLLQAYRHKSAVDGAYQQGMIAGTTNEANLRTEVDSLKKDIDDQKVAFADSLSRTKTDNAEQVDSLEKQLLARDSVITAQKANAKKLAAAPKQTEPKSVAQPVDQQHQQILSYYKQRCESLPRDLTDYERKVAFAEIRSETAQKFAITISELNHIRSTYKLGY